MIEVCEFVGRLNVTTIRCLVIPVSGTGVIVLRGSVGSQAAGLIEFTERELGLGSPASALAVSAVFSRSSAV